jgi:hypothetical protein
MVDLAKILHSVCYTSVISKCNDIVILLFRCISVFLMMITTVMKMTTLTTVTMMTAKMMMTMMAMMPLGMTIMTTMRSSDAPDI